MPRRLRLQYPGTIYHVMARGNGRQDIVRDDDDRRRLQDHLARAAAVCSWRVYAYVLMTNHLHLVLKTPAPNLARGMQRFLSAYANAWARRHRFGGHVFQERYRTELVGSEKRDRSDIDKIGGLVLASSACREPRESHLVEWCSMS